MQLQHLKSDIDSGFRKKIQFLFLLGTYRILVLIKPTICKWDPSVCMKMGKKEVNDVRRPRWEPLLLYRTVPQLSSTLHDYHHRY